MLDDAWLRFVADIDPITLSSLIVFADQRLAAVSAVAAIGLAYLANVVFKLSVPLATG